MGYRSHPGLQYSLVASPQPPGSELGIPSRGNSDGPADTSNRPAHLNYDPQYGYAV